MNLKKSSAKQGGLVRIPGASLLLRDLRSCIDSDRPDVAQAESISFCGISVASYCNLILTTSNGVTDILPRLGVTTEKHARLGEYNQVRIKLVSLVRAT